MTEIIIRFRWWIIGICLTLGLVGGALIPFAGTDPDIRNYVPPTLPSRERTDSIEAEFGVQDLVLILFSDSCIINETGLKQVHDADRAISSIKGISNRISPFTVRTISGEGGILSAERLVSSLPHDSSDVAEIKGRILASEFARDLVVSADMTTAAITATINSNEPETVTLSHIDSALAASPGKAEILRGGLPIIRKYILGDVRKDGLMLVPAALLVMLLILKFSLGEWKVVFMPFSVVILSAMISLGLIPLFGWKMSVITLLVPVILIAVANNYGIYLAARSQELARDNPGLSGKPLLKELLGSLNTPILFSGLTTIAGILGLLAHSVIPARQVGILAATGVTIALLMSLFMIPALIYPGKHKNSDKRSSGKFNILPDRLPEELSKLIINYPGHILVYAAVVTLLISSGIFFLRTDTNQENFFPRSHPVRKAGRIISSKFGGSQTISVMVSGDIMEPALLKGIDSLTRAAGALPGVGRVFSISQVVREISKAVFLPGEEGFDKIPDTREAVAQIFELYYMSGDPEDFRQLINPENTKAQVLIRVSDPSNKVTNHIKSELGNLSESVPGKMTIGGYAIIMSDFAVSLIRGQVASLVFALVTVFILLAIVFRSMKGGLIGSIPLGVSVIILFGFMGLAGIALDAATALLSSIMIGVGVDFTIQYVWCLNSFLSKGEELKIATKNAMRTIGRSIIINALSVMAGFSALLLSGFTSIRFFGCLVIISIGACLIGAIVVIPALIIWFRPAFVMSDFKTRLRLNRHKTE